jgi:hypothetical protein
MSTGKIRTVVVTEMDQSFDQAFWERVWPEGRFFAAWDMVLEVNAIKEKEHYEPRL